jgi:hypothetical protein
VVFDGRKNLLSPLELNLGGRYVHRLPGLHY